MRVGVIGHRSPDTLTENVFVALESLGIETVPLGGLSLRFQSIRVGQVAAKLDSVLPMVQRHLQQRVIEAAADAKCDVILTADKRLSPQAVKDLQSHAHAVALWFPDAVSNVGNFAFADAPYSALFLTDSEFVERMRSIYRQNAFFLPEACNPSWHRPIGIPNSQPYIAVVGGFSSYRIRLLRELRREGIPLRLFGPPFPQWADTSELVGLHSGRYVTKLEKSRVFREARGVLNNLHPAVMSGINCRSFEVAAAGGVLITEWRPALPELFSVGTEVLAFTDFETLVNQCRSVIGEPLGVPIGNAASRRAHLDHTFEQRIQHILEKLV